MLDKDNILGCFVDLPEGYECYIPYDINQIDFDFSADVLIRTTEVTSILGQLEGQATQLAELYAGMFIWTESYYSHLLAGGKIDYLGSLSHLLRRRGESKKGKDGRGGREARREAREEAREARQIARGKRAFETGWQRLREVPVSTDFLIQLHRLLLEDGSASLRREPNWLGGKDLSTATFISPPPYEVANAMAELEQFINRQDKILPLLKLGLVYAQLETIRPFESSNGRSARLLLHLLIILKGLLSLPLLCLSRQFYLNQQSYYEALDAYRQGDYERWLSFFLASVEAAGRYSLKLMKEILVIRSEDLASLAQLSKTANENGRSLLDHLFNLPLVDVTQAIQWLAMSRPAAQTTINRLVDLNILSPLNEEKKYSRTYVYRRYFDILTS